MLLLYTCWGYMDMERILVRSVRTVSCSAGWTATKNKSSSRSSGTSYEQHGPICLQFFFYYMSHECICCKPNGFNRRWHWNTIADVWANMRCYSVLFIFFFFFGLLLYYYLAAVFGRTQELRRDTVAIADSASRLVLRFICAFRFLVGRAAATFLALKHSPTWNKTNKKKSILPVQKWIYAHRKNNGSHESPPARNWYCFQ